MVKKNTGKANKAPKSPKVSKATKPEITTAPKVNLDVTVPIDEDDVSEIGPEVKAPVVKKTEEPTVKNGIVMRIKENAVAFGKHYFDTTKEAGCDLSFAGEWQQAYGGLIARLLETDGKKVLDIGGAFGTISHAIATIGKCKVLNVDISKHVVENQTFKEDKLVPAIVAPIQHMKQVDDESFDAVHISHVLNYVHPEDLERSIKEVARVLKSGGKCFIIHSGKTFKKDAFSVDHKELIALCEEYIGDVLKIDTAKVDDRDYKFFANYTWDCLLIQKK